MLVLDLKSHSEICQASRKLFQGRSTYVFSNTCVYSSHGLHVVENLSALCATVSRQFRRQKFHLSGPVPHHGFRPTDVSRKPAGHRSLPSSTKQKTLSHGHPQQGFAQHSGGSERDAGLAYLRRFRPSSDRHRQETLPEGTLGRRTEKHGLRLGCYDDRPLPVYLSLGAVPSGKQREPSDFIPCWTCGAISRALSISPTEKSTKSMCWI